MWQLATKKLLRRLVGSTGASVPHRPDVPALGDESQEIQFIEVAVAARGRKVRNSGGADSGE